MCVVVGDGGSWTNGNAPTAPTAPTAKQHTLKQRPSAATPVKKQTSVKKPAPVKKRPSGKADGDDDDAGGRQLIISFLSHSSPTVTSSWQ